VVIKKFVVPQQPLGTIDCGLYILLYAKHVLQKYDEKGYFSTELNQLNMFPKDEIGQFSQNASLNKTEPYS